ncbi:hypothetical protein IFM58399_00829 [Aspergillus lentulus]|uniref:uncharacterized protein n=1 Tax=Aspergillus lentulus TaxID=293939 RepID=UPI001394283B|nr:uncharacterized protein IFM58399_00829 [Aspergillus lentulus]GFF24912.1 hypothetical protein IFM58399_00829 [Aspergillus lentulus]
MRPSTVTSLPFLIFSSLSISPGTANLNGKNPSLESHALSHCIAADNSSSASGTTFFISPLVNNGSTQLSWTLGIHIQNSSDDTGRNKLIQIERDFYFGLGSDPGSIQNASFRACSIFYHGASEPLYSDANPDGRRTQELSDDCVRDLTALVNNTAQELMPQNDGDLSNVSFTNRNTSSTSSSGNCHSSSGGDYNLTLVDSNSFANANGSTNLKNMVLGATPIITVFYPESNLSRPDIQYMALKPEDTSNLIGQVSGSLASGFTAPSIGEEVLGEGHQEDIAYSRQQDPPLDGEPFEALAASSSGKSKYYMLADHNGPSELNKLVPQKAEFSLEDDGGLPAIAWNLGRD